MNGSERILAVDDDEAKRYAWQRTLTRAGYEVSIASTGGEALRMARSNPDLIILDVRLPDINGKDVCRRLKDDMATASIPVLHISASLVTSEDRTAALEGGADGYLTEPVDPEELVASVKALLRMRRAEDKARKAAAEWQTTFDTIQDGVVVVDARGIISRCNEAFLSILGRPAAEILGRPIKILLQQQLRMSQVDSFVDVSRDRDRRTTDLLWQDRWFRVTLDPVIVTDSTAGCICLFSDVTERKRAIQEIQAGKEELRTLNANLEERVVERTRKLQTAVRELEAFTYTIAHDLRAPLRAIHRFSEILGDEFAASLNSEGQDYLRRIVGGAEKMDALIDDLLSYSRLAQSEIHLQPLQPAAIVDEVTRSLLSDSSVALPEIRVDDDLPLVAGDRVLLSQVFGNLLSNAIKFVPPGTRPKIRVTGERRGDRVKISVIDNGIGIPPESHSRLFRVFERLGGAKDYPGTGIGLAIVRRAMERMGGECGVDSSAGPGARFWILLPSGEGANGGAR